MKDIVWRLLEGKINAGQTVSFTHLPAHEKGRKIVCRLLLVKKKNKQTHRSYLIDCLL